MERKIHFRENWLITLGIWGEARLILRGAKEKYFQRAEEFSFRDLGRSVHYFQGSREHRPPWGPRCYTICNIVTRRVNIRGQEMSQYLT